jgi:hypothetical protein
MTVEMVYFEYNAVSDSLKKGINSFFEDPFYEIPPEGLSCLQLIEWKEGRTLMESAFDAGRIDAHYEYEKYSSLDEFFDKNLEQFAILAYLKGWNLYH